jgi:hypothetical protein
LTILVFNHGLGIAPQTVVLSHLPSEGQSIVRGEAVTVVDANAEIPDLEAVYDDVDHEDEFEGAYVDV